MSYVHLKRSRLLHGLPRRQHGVYALEWAILFPVFFALVYAIIFFGLSFLVRESMQSAVEEGARAALRYPSHSRIGSGMPTWEHRSDEARDAVVAALRWLPAPLTPAADDVRFTVCHVEEPGCDINTPLRPNLVCDTATPCLVLVSLTMNGHASAAMAPEIPAYRLLLPQALQAQASILVDRRML